MIFQQCIIPIFVTKLVVLSRRDNVWKMLYIAR